MKPRFTRFEENLKSSQLYDMLAQAIYMDVQIFSLTLEILRKNIQKQDFSQFLISKEIDQHYFNCHEQFISGNLTNNIQKIRQLIKLLMEHDFNQNNYSSEIYSGVRKQLIKKISKVDKIIECLKFLVNLSAIDDTFIQTSSNSLCLLVEMRISLANQCCQNIKIANTSIIGANFAKSNLSGSEFENVQIDRINLNGALLLNCKWKNLILGEFCKLKTNFDMIENVCFSPDGVLLASTSKYCHILIWNLKTRKLQHKSQLNLCEEINGLCLSPDNTTLACGDNEGKIIIWNYRLGKIKCQLNLHYYAIWQVYYWPDGTMLASNDYKTIRIWDMKTGAAIYTFELPNQIRSKPCFSPNENLFAFDNGDGCVFLYDFKTGQQKQEISGHPGRVWQIRFSPDGALLASGCNYGEISLWDVKMGQRKFWLQKLHKSEIRSLCFSPDGTILASSSLDQSLRLWDVNTGQQKSYYIANQKISSLCFSQCGALLASCNYAETINLWDAKGGEKDLLQDENVFCINTVSFSPDGTIFASGGFYHAVHLWDVKTGKLKFKLSVFDGDVKSVCFSPDGTLLASCASSICLWNVQTGKLQSQLNGPHDRVYSVCFSPDGTLLAAVDEGACICLWDVKAKKIKSQLNGHTKEIFCICFSPDGLTLASGGKDKHINLWDVKAKKIKTQLKEHNFSVTSIDFSPDGRMLASGSRESICLWDLREAKLQMKLKGHQSDIMSVRFSPNGLVFASGGDKFIKLWDVKTGKLSSQFKEDNNQFYSICFSPDGTILASGGKGISIRLWDNRTEERREQENDIVIPDYLDDTIFLKDLIYHYMLKVNPTVPTTFIPQSFFQAIGALILNGEFYSHLGVDLKSFLEQKGAIILNNY